MRWQPSDRFVCKVVFAYDAHRIGPKESIWAIRATQIRALKRGWTMSSKFRSVVLIVLGLALCASNASAQNVYASVTGTVSDPQTNPMPGVKVTATNTGTALVRTAVTDSRS